MGWELLALVVGGLVVSAVVAVLFGRLLRRTNAQYPPVTKPVRERVPAWLRIGGGGPRDRS